MVSTSSANEDMLLSSGVESDTNLNEAVELSMSSGYDTTSSLNKSTLQQNRVSLQKLAMVSERYEVCDRADVAIASATLKACGIVTEENKKYVVDSSKFLRKRQKHR